MRSVKKIPTHKIRNWVLRHKTVLIRSGMGLFVLLMLVQFFYPGSHLPLFASIDGVNVGGWSKDDAVRRLNALSKKQKIAITLGEAGEVYTHVNPHEIGLTVSHKTRVQYSTYPWYLRIIPTSLFWFGPFQAEKPATYASDKGKVEAFLKNDLGASCNIPPKNASLKFSDDKLAVVPATDGGTCNQRDALAALGSAQPVVNEAATVTIPVKVTQPKVNDQAAKKLAESLEAQVTKGVEIDVAGDKRTINRSDILSWLTFTPKDDELTFTVDAIKAGTYMAKNITPAVTKPAGVTKVTTRDFTEVARINGANGQTIALGTTLQSIAAVLQGKAEVAKASTTAVAPKVEYTRSYTKTSTGIAALLQHYADDHPGTFGVSFAELDGRGLSANHNSSQSFITASTYKLFVAYGTLKKIEKKEWKWSDNVTGGRNLSTCFDDMIVKSDNPCAEALYEKIGYKKVINDVRALGLKNTVLARDGQRTTSGDLALFLTKLQNKTLDINDSSRDRLLSAMKRNVYRQGIPAGASGDVADKVGFLNGLLHDASIVYSPKGTYVLVVMTDGSTWGNIAELTRKIESLR